MNKNLLIPFFLLVSIGLAACTTEPQKQWIHPERSAAESTSDKVACEFQAETGARNRLGAIDEKKMAELFRQCMEKQGYRLGEKGGL